MEKLILRYLQGDISKAEIEELNAWLQRDSINRKVFVNLVGEWNLSDQDIEKSRALVLERILSSDNQIQQKRSLNSWDYLIRIAAIIVIGLGIAFLVRTSFIEPGVEIAQQEIIIEKETEPGQKLTFELPDGSMVKLNAGSKLIYPKEFSDDQRKVQLIGEAFFDVKRDEARPFMISSSDLNIEVLGTSFNVTSYPGDKNLEVAVKTGKVAVTNTQDNSRMILEHEEMAIYSVLDKKIKKKHISADDFIFGWTDQYLVLNDMEFQDIMKVISRWHNVEFELNGTFDSSKKFTGKYKNPPLREVMESLSYAYDFNYKINEKRVTISK